MTIPLDMSRDYKVVDNGDLVSVTYQSKTGNGTYPSGEATYDSSTVAHVLQRMVKKEDVSKGPGLLEGDKGRFHLWTANLVGVVPKLGDLLTPDDGILRVVRDVEVCDLDDSGEPQRYVLTCARSTQVV